MTKTDRKQPYALYFFLLSVLLIATSFWVLWFEFIKLRPWGSYQQQYYQLRRDQLEQEYAETLDQLSDPKTENKRQELSKQLAVIEENFGSEQTQAEYLAVKQDLETKQAAIRTNRDEFRTARGLYLELEYLYYKNQSDQDKVALVELDLEIQELELRNQALTAQKEELNSQLSAFKEESETVAAELRALESPVIEARRRIDKLNEIPVEIKQVFLPDINKADRCQTCHIGIDNSNRISDQQPFTTHPASFIYLDNHPTAEFGCTFCHRGQGRATSSADKAHGWIEHWLEPLLQGGMTQASCQTCHGNLQNLRGGELVALGSQTVERYGCYGCHRIAGYDDLRKVGPDLTEVGTKVNYSWLVEWIKDPKNYLPEARMPKFYFSQPEAEAIADYLFSMTRQARLDDSPAEIDWDLADHGKTIWRSSRCSICHAVNSVGGAHKETYTPDLGQVGTKVNDRWLHAWIKDPKDYFPLTRMPRFRFQDDEIDALTEYIRSEYVDWDFEPIYTEPVAIEVESIRKGKELIQSYGCFGCHNVKGMEEMARIGPYLRRDEVSYFKAAEVDEKVGAELSSIGSKAIEQLDFGKMAKEIPADRISYMKQKLSEPRSFRDDLKMPDFGFSEEELNALVTMLVGFADKDVPARFKVPKNPSSYEPTGEFAKIVDDVKCLNCHAIRGNGDEFAPDLSIEGSKVQEAWLRDFLKRPDIIRPMLKQMPLFKLDHERQMIQGNLTYPEIETVVQYFKQVLVSNEIPETLPKNGLALEEQIEAGKKLYETKGCRTCHQIGSDGGAVGPGLTNVGNRLTEGWVYTYLKNPQALIPNTIEPDFGFTDKERVNLTRYLSSLKQEQLP